MVNRKVPDVKLLHDETGAYFIGTQKECNDFIKENDLKVTSWEAIEMIYWKPRLVFYAIFVNIFGLLWVAIDYFFKTQIQFTSFFMGFMWALISVSIDECTKSK